MDEIWNAVDDYFAARIIGTDDALDAALRDSDAAGLPPIQVTAPQGKLLHLLARMCGARRILEIGTLGGYSTICLARALPPGGRLVTLEINSTHAEVAWKNFARAGIEDRVELRLAPAADSLADLIATRAEPFDFIFIDADKQSTAPYFEQALRLSRPGTVIIVDNVVRKGDVANDESDDENVLGIRRFVDRLAQARRVSATAIQTVGSKGYDGFVLAIVDG
jgi:predicted O-methyltransferase YrrM